MASWAISCVRCGLKKASEEELEIHIASDHLRFHAYECHLCPYAKFPTEFALRDHCLSVHKLKECYVCYLATDEFQTKRKALKTLMDKSLNGVEQELVIDSPMAASPYNMSSISQVLQENHHNLHKPPLKPGLSHYATTNESVQCVDLTNEDDQDSSELLDSSIELRRLVSPPNASSRTPLPTIEKFTVLQPTDALMAPKPLSGKRKALPGVETITGPAKSNNRVTKPTSKKTERYSSEKKTSHNSSPTVSGLKPTNIYCGDCGATVANNGDSIRNHASLKHMKNPMFECSDCQKTWCSVKAASVARRHGESHHLRKNTIIDHRPKFADDLKVLVSRLFHKKL